MYLDLIFKLIDYCNRTFNRYSRKFKSKTTFKIICFRKYVWDKTLEKCLNNPDIDPVDIIVNEIETYSYRQEITTVKVIKEMYTCWINALYLLKTHAEK